MVNGKKFDINCPCCGKPAIIEYKPSKWQGEKDRVVITHKKWQESYS